MDFNAGFAATILSALGHESRLEVYRLLIEHAPDGLPAGMISDHLGIQPPVASFHLRQLKHADLVSSKKEGRHVIYSPRFDTMAALLNFLYGNCCQGKVPLSSVLPETILKNLNGENIKPSD